jgi:MacB-like periplasmic core domain
MTYLRELVSQVVGSLMRNKLRSILTMAGIAWGLASIVIIVAMGDGFKEGQHNNVKTLGENLAIVFGGRTELQAGGQRAGSPRAPELFRHRKYSPRVLCSLAGDAGTGGQCSRDEPF